MHSVELPEHRLRGNVRLVDETGVGIVAKQHERTLVRNADQAVPQPHPLLQGHRVAARVRRQIEDRHRRLAGRPVRERFGEGGSVVGPFAVGGGRDHGRAGARRERLPIVAPERARHGQDAVRAAEQIRHQR